MNGEDMETVTTMAVTPAEKAAQLMADSARLDDEKKALIVRLTEERDAINAALVALGAKRTRKKAEPKKRGRPAGSKNRVESTEAAQ